MKFKLIIFCLIASFGYALVQTPLVLAQDELTVQETPIAAEIEESSITDELEAVAEVTEDIPEPVAPAVTENKDVLLGVEELILENEEDHIDFFSQQNLTKENNLRQMDLYHLQKAKFKFINGDLNLAEFYLNRIDDKKSNVVNVKKRYMAMIYFLRNNFAKSIEMLNHPRVNNANYFHEVCLLRVVNFIALNDLGNLKSEAKRCQALTMPSSRNNQYWLEMMINVKLSNQNEMTKFLSQNLNQVFRSDDLSRLWLKTGLYLNKETEVAKLLSNLSSSAYQSTQLREIVAFTFFRLKQYDKALSFIDDIDSANAENIKGNIRLANKEYELAFGHFRLALQKKQDSTNSLERAIPLAWLLGQWDDGIKMLSNITDSKIQKRNKDILKIAFLIRKNELVQAQNELRILKSQFSNDAPFEVEIMDSFVNLVLEKDLSTKELRVEKRRVEDSIEKTCRAFDGVSCWLSMQYLQWDNFGKTIHRDTPVYTDDTLSIESLKQAVAIVPLEEERNVDQSDIEELDGNFIKLLPQ